MPRTFEDRGRHTLKGVPVRLTLPARYSLGAATGPVVAGRIFELTGSYTTKVSGSACSRSTA